MNRSIKFIAASLGADKFRLEFAIAQDAI